MPETREGEKSMNKSNCHHAPMDVAGEGTTHFYVCRKCGQHCDPEIKIETVPDEVVEPRLTIVGPDLTSRITFSGGRGIVGILEWQSGVLTFTGNADESAKVFFDEVIRRYFIVDDIKTRIRRDSNNASS